MNNDPDLPPLRPGLPYTTLEACQLLILAIVAQGILDDDMGYITSPTFLHHLMYVGMDPYTAINVRVRVLKGQVDKYRLSYIDAPRFRVTDPRSEICHWKSWPVSALG